MKIYINTFFLMLVFTSAITAQKSQETKGISESILTFKNSRESINNIPLNIPLNILEIPKPKYPVRENGTICITGNIRLRVEFLASGKIGKISPVSSLPYGLIEKAIEAAEKIKFEPAIKNGETITVFKVVVMSFTIY